LARHLVLDFVAGKEKKNLHQLHYLQPSLWLQKEIFLLTWCHTFNMLNPTTWHCCALG